MREHTYCGALTDYDTDCPATPVQGSPVPLCLRHLQIATDWYRSMVNDPQRIADAIDRVFSEPDPAPTSSRAPDPVVYFIRFRDLVKIGTTTNLTRRLTALPYDELLATFPGGRTTEQSLHRRFHKLRVRGEWFSDDPDIRNFIAAARRNSAAARR